MNAVLSQPQGLSNFGEIILPSRGRFVAQTDTEIKNPLEAAVKLFDAPEFAKTIEAILPKGLGIREANKEKNLSAQDKSAEFRSAIVETLTDHFKTHFQGVASIANLQKRLDEIGSPSTNIAALLKISETNAFAGTREKYKEILIGALDESLKLLIPASKAELSKPVTIFEKALNDWAYKSGKENDPNKRGKDAYDINAVNTALSEALPKILPADFLRENTHTTEIRIGELQLIFSDNAVVINDKISNIKTTIQISESETDVKKREFFSNLLNNLKSDSSIASSQNKFSEAILQLITASAGNVAYETYELRSIARITESYPIEKIEEVTEEALPTPTDIPPLAETKETPSPPVEEPISKTADEEIEEVLELLGGESDDLNAPEEIAKPEKNVEKTEEKPVDPLAVPETPSPSNTPPEKVATPTPPVPTQPSLLEELREEMALFKQSLAKADPTQTTELPILLNSLNAQTIHGNFQSTGIISNLKVYTELGQLYVEITTKDSKGNDTLLSFRLNEGAANEALLKALLDLGRNLNKDAGTDISNSKTLLDLLAIAQIQSVQPKNGGEIVLENINWLGSFLAAEAEISNVTFKNSNLDLSGQNSVISGCRFEGCRISMNLVDAQISDSVFDKKTVITGRLACTFTGGELHANAFTLDLRDTQFDFKDTRKALRGVIFDRNLIPIDIKVYCTPVTDKRLAFEQKQVQERFNQDTIRAIIHEYSQTNLTTKVGGYSGIPLISSNWHISKSAAGNKIDQRVIQSVLEPAVAGISDEYIDLYPPESDLLDKKKAEELTRLRILMAKDGRMFIKYGTAKELENFTLLEKVVNDGKIIYGSNLKIFQEVLNFYHVSRSEASRVSSNAVEVPED